MFNPLELLKDVSIDFTRKDFSIAVVGLGKMGLLHAAILNLLCRGAVKYVVDENRFVRIGGRLLIKSIKFLDSLEKLINLRESIDAVYVTTPTQTHFYIVKRLLEAGFKNIFIEKPPTRSLEQFNELLDLKKDANVMIGFQKRFSLPLRHAKNLLNERILGDLEKVYVSIRSGDITEPNKRFKHLGRGVLIDLGIHVIDLLCWFFDEKLEVKSARYETIHSGVDDYFEAELNAGNVKIFFETTWSDPSYRLPETCIEIKGSKGELKVGEDYLKVKIYEHRKDMVNSELSLYRPHYYQGFPPVLIADQEFTIENMHFLSTIEHKKRSVTSLESCRFTMALLEELYGKASYG